MSSVQEKQCWECKQPVFTINDGAHLAGKMLNGQFTAFTDKYGNPKLQEYDDEAGENAHYLSCPVKVARKRAQSGQQGMNQFQGREKSNTYVPTGYVQKPNPPVQQIPTPQIKPEPAVLTQIQTTVEAIQTMLAIVKRDQELNNEKVDYIYRYVKALREGENNSQNENDTDETMGDEAL